jgi:hypothetical protein
MGPLSAAEVALVIAHAVVTYLDTGQTFELTSKPDKHCSFFEWFCAGDYEVQLRLDWADIDPHGQPTLDADFRNPVTKKHDRSMKGDPAHQTDSIGTGGRAYEWRFAGTTLCFTVAVTWSLQAGPVHARSPVSTTPTVFRPAEQEPQNQGVD